MEYVAGGPWHWKEEQEDEEMGLIPPSPCLD